MFRNRAWRLAADETAATSIEYGMIATFVAVAIAGSMLTLGNEVQTTFETVDTRYAEAANGRTPG